MTSEDWEAVAAIYAEGISTGDATFETTVPTWAEWDASHHMNCRLVMETDDDVAGWAALAPVSSRDVYRGVAESSIYIASSARGLGIGSRLLAALVACSETAGFWMLQAGVFPENEASIRLHERRGFRIVGTRQRIGRLGSVWRDVILLERRSSRID